MHQIETVAHDVCCNSGNRADRFLGDLTLFKGSQCQASQRYVKEEGSEHSKKEQSVRVSIILALMENSYWSKHV